MLTFLAAAAVYEIGTVWPKSDPPEAVFSSREPKEVSSAIASGCLDARRYRWSVVEQSDNLVICETPPDSVHVSIARLGGANLRFRGMVRFVIVGIGGSSRVRADLVTEETNVFGRVISHQGSDDPSRVQDFLIALGGSYPSGMVLDGTDIGIRGQLDDSGRSAAFRITRVEPDGPAAQAGLQSGDLIVTVNGKKLPVEQSQFRWFIGKIKPGQVAAIAYSRGGQASSTLVTARPGRPSR